MRYSLTINEEHLDRFKKLLLRDDREAGAYLRCERSSQLDPWIERTEVRFLCQEVIEVAESHYFERLPHRLRWSTTQLFDLAKRCDRRVESIGIAHSHPYGPLAFSELDDIADREAAEIVYNRMENAVPLLSIIIDGGGNLLGRAITPDGRFHEISVIRVVGPSRWSLLRQPKVAREETFDRQSRVFANDPTPTLRELRAGVVGCGGTGSAVAVLLAHLGVGRIVLFDPDRVEESNLSRIHGATRRDAIAGANKADVLTRHLSRMGLSHSVRSVSTSVDLPGARNAIKSCDVIFGCTDDLIGRAFLNRLAYFYLIPVIDMGVAIEPRESGGYYTFDGRVTVVEPGSSCLLCRNVVQVAALSTQVRARNDPVRHELYVRAGYVVNSDAPNPAVVTFTTEIAAVAIAELLQRLTAFCGPLGECRGTRTSLHRSKGRRLCTRSTNRFGLSTLRPPAL